MTERHTPEFDVTVYNNVTVIETYALRPPHKRTYQVDKDTIFTAKVICDLGCGVIPTVKAYRKLWDFDLYQSLGIYRYVNGDVPLVKIIGKEYAG